MSENKCSKLNPLAISFEPSKENESSFIRVTAERYIHELIESKKANGEKCLTKHEMANVVGKLISLRYKTSKPVDRLKIDHFLSDRILNSALLDPKPSTKPITGKQSFTKFIPFKLSKFQPPKRTFLLVAFWGLYRYEQAQLPLLSLTYRPLVVQDPVWSVQSSDKKLLNASCVEKECECPPMFGYTIPNSFFGNPLSTNYICSEDRIHLNHYAESSEGNEHILTTNWDKRPVDEYSFEEEIPSCTEVCVDLTSLKEQFETTVAAICSLLDFEESLDTDQQDENQTSENPPVSSDATFWEENLEASYIPFSEKRQNLVDDDEHPLLEISDFTPDEGVSQEIKEMIRRSLSPKKEFRSVSLDLTDEDVDLEEEQEEVFCDPPCSVWCNTPCKSNDDGHVSETELDPRTPTEEVLKIDLVSLDKLESPKETKTEKAKTLFLEPALDLIGTKVRRPSFRRCFSINDCDPSYYDKKFGLTGPSAEASVSSKDMFALLKRDPVNFFKTFNRSNSWKDSDSGFVSQWSSHEDLNGDRYDPEDPNSMWGHISGEDSLWKPLPECANQDIEEEKPLPHRRVRDLRRQLSLN